MTDELKLRKDAAQGARAQTLIDDPLLTGIFEELETEYINHWRESTALNDMQGRERIWQAVQIVGKVRTHMRVIADNGRMAMAELQNLAQGGK